MTSSLTLQNASLDKFFRRRPLLQMFLDRIPAHSSRKLTLLAVQSWSRCGAGEDVFYSLNQDTSALHYKQGA